ncbi:RING and UBP finger domain, putative [Babesia ovis]|uniref:RING and UBP finger domain, putative n=1 Tax=Babesia ovis TaxID=5869 RepID=A0A9W5WTK0_BABOV|nr:RING and UBP finger domain, putative [Babesia ovis]
MEDYTTNENEQLPVLRANLESEYFGSIDEAVKAYKALQGKFQCLVREFYRKESEFRNVSGHLLGQVEALSQENHRISVENMSLRTRNIELGLRLEGTENKKYQGGQCLPVGLSRVRSLLRL